MNYRHAYHAGNFADVLKHILLIELIRCLQQKEAPFFYLDTHAGTGLYNLNSLSALKTGEAAFGIKRILSAPKLPACLTDYVNTVKACQASPHDYPGSPLIARHWLRSHDRMAAVELHTMDCEALQSLFKKDPQVKVLHQDGYLSLKALLPPKERRGLIFIDPPFEDKDEFKHILSAIKIALQRFKTGVYAIWYPIKNTREVAHFMQQLELLGQPLFNITLDILSGTLPQGLNDTGVVIVNPPWRLPETVKALMPQLSKILTPSS